MRRSWPLIFCTLLAAGAASAAIPGLDGDKLDDEGIDFLSELTVPMGAIPAAFAVAYFSADDGGVLPEGDDANPCTRVAPCQSAILMETLAQSLDQVIVLDSDTWIDASPGEELEGFVGFDLSDTGCGSGGPSELTDEPCAIFINIHAYDGSPEYTRTRFDCRNVPAIDGIATGGLNFLSIRGGGSGYFAFIGVESYRCPDEQHGDTGPGAATSIGWAVEPGSGGRGNLVALNTGSLELAGAHPHPYRLQRGKMVILNSEASSADNSAWDQDCVGPDCRPVRCDGGLESPFECCRSGGACTTLQHAFEFNDGAAILVGSTGSMPGRNLGFVNGNGPVCLVSDAGSGIGGVLGDVLVVNQECRWSEAPYRNPAGLARAELSAVTANQDADPNVANPQFWRMGRNNYGRVPLPLPSGTRTQAFRLSEANDGQAGDVMTVQNFFSVATGFDHAYRIKGQVAGDEARVVDDATIWDDLHPVGSSALYFQVEGASPGLVRLEWGPRVVYDTDEGVGSFQCSDTVHATASQLLAASTPDPLGLECSTGATNRVVVNGSFAGATGMQEGPGESGGLGTDATAWNDSGIDLSPVLGCAPTHECAGLAEDFSQILDAHPDIFIPSLILGQPVRRFEVGTHYDDAGWPPPATSAPPFPPQGVPALHPTAHAWVAALLALLGGIALSIRRRSR